MGQVRGPYPQERGGVAGEEGAATAGATAGADAPGGDDDGEPSVRAGLKQFLKVTRSYWPGLFRCYDAADLPRTNNDLEHLFGSHRYHERRSSGRRRASPGLVVMGSARVISGLATRLRPEEGLVLRPGYVEGWQELRAELEARRERGGSSGASAMTRPPISRSWSNSVSS